VSLVERHSDLAGYLRNAAADLGLDSVEVELVPVESWTEGTGAYDLVTSRKMGRSNTILGWVAPLLRPGGLAVLFYKERVPEAEAMAAEAAAANKLSVSEIVPVSAAVGRVRGCCGPTDSRAAIGSGRLAIERKPSTPC
jgi:16S rRNA G527 N7-methylase RsmG